MKTKTNDNETNKNESLTKKRKFVNVIGNLIPVNVAIIFASSFSGNMTIFTIFVVTIVLLLVTFFIGTLKK